MNHVHDDDDIVYSKVIAAHIKIAAVLTKNAETVLLTHAQRQSVPHELTLSDGKRAFAHIRQAVHPGDRLVAPVNQFAVVQAAIEPITCLSGPHQNLLQAAHALGEAHFPVMVAEHGINSLEHETVHAIAHACGLAVHQENAAFIPSRTVLAVEHAGDHAHHHHEHGPNCGHSH